MAKDTRWTGQHPRPVQRIELKDGHTKRRIIAVAVLLAIGLGCIGYALFQWLHRDGGWQEITVSGSADLNCGSEFTLIYDVDEDSAVAEYKAVSTLYSQSAVEAYRLFDPAKEYPGLGNLWQLNAHPGEEVVLEPAVWNALSLLEKAGRREQYLAPLYAWYRSLYASTTEEGFNELDPEQHPDVMADYAAAAAFAGDPEMISIQLGDGHRATLQVAPAYKTFVEENTAGLYVDLGWMENAFRADYIAEAMAKAGYTKGILTSYDGFTRNIDRRKGSFGYLMTALQDGKALATGELTYGGDTAVVALRAYGLDTDPDDGRFYRTSDGKDRSLCIDVTDGRCRTSLHELYCFSQGGSCASLLTEVLPVWIADDAGDFAAALEAKGISVALWDGNKVQASDGLLN